MFQLDDSASDFLALALVLVLVLWILVIVVKVVNLLFDWWTDFRLTFIMLNQALKTSLTKMLVTKIMATVFFWDFYLFKAKFLLKMIFVVNISNCVTNIIVAEKSRYLILIDIKISPSTQHAYIAKIDIFVLFVIWKKKYQILRGKFFCKRKVNNFHFQISL